MTGRMQGPARGRRTPWRWIGWGAAGLLLLAPAVAMRFTDEVSWSGADFLVFGAMLAVAGGAAELAVRRTTPGGRRAGVLVAIGVAFLALWAWLAVGRD